MDHLPHTHSLEHAAFTKGQPDWGCHLADNLEDIVALHGANNVAGVIVEPVAGSAGVLIPPKGYLERLRELCDKHNLLLIFDEVITGFGRLGGAPFAADYFDVTPDMITTAKNLTGAVVRSVRAHVSVYGVAPRHSVFENINREYQSRISLALLTHTSTKSLENQLSNTNSNATKTRTPTLEHRYLQVL